MSRRLRVLLGALLVIGACASPKPVASPAPEKAASLPPEATTEREVSLLLSILDERAKDRKGFTASYRVQDGDSLKMVRFAYLAPGRARADLRSGTSTIVTCAADGVIMLRIDDGETSRVVRFDWNEVEALWGDCTAALDTAFPSTDADDATPSDLECGPVFGFGIRPGSRASDDSNLSATIMWLKSRPTLLSWLAPKEWERARFVDAQTIEVWSGTKTATLSAATGLFLNMKLNDRFHAELVQSTDVVDPSEFALLSATADTDEFSCNVVKAFDAECFEKYRENTYQRILPAARTAIADLESLQHRAEPVFAALHRAWLKRQFATWINETESSSERYLEQVSAYESTIPSDKDQRAVVDRQYHDWRSSLEHGLLASRDEGLARLQPFPVSPENREASAVLWELERRVLIAEFNHGVSEPLLRHIDEYKKELRGGR